MSIFLYFIGGIILVAGLSLLGFYLRIIQSGIRVDGTICDIVGAPQAVSSSTHTVRVKFRFQDKDIEADTLKLVFLVPFLVNRQLKRLKKKYIGKQVHIYFNPKNQAQVLIKEYIWKVLICPLFMILLGVLVIGAGWFKCY